MLFKNNPKLAFWLAGAVFVGAIPVLAQKEAPESILPPGFGEPDAPPAKSAKPDRPDRDVKSPSDEPADLLPDVGLNVPANDQNGAKRSSTAAASGATIGDLIETDTAADGADETATVAAIPQDLPSYLRRSTTRVGVLGADDGDMGPAAFAGFKGKFLTELMRRIEAPLASRWGSIVLRRALLSRVDTPAGINGADWAAERAWLLLRMGEADPARMLTQAVDVDQYTPKMFDVSMQAALATADPAGLCSVYETAIAKRKDPAWLMARAMCAGLSGESAQAAALIDIARAKTKARGIDALLAEKVIGAGGNTRRAVSIQWDGVGRLTTWRYGLATATAVDIPERLIGGAPLRVLAWQARAPLLTATQRLRSADIAATLGVFSASALADHYSAVGDETDPAEAAGKPPALLRAAFAGGDAAARQAALTQLWDSGGADPRLGYARLLVSARAAAMVTPSAAGDVDRIVAALLSAGHDTQADRWRSAAEAADGEIGARAQALLAVGGSQPLTGYGRSAVRTYAGESGAGGDVRARYLFAGLAGLGRLSSDDVSALAQAYEIPVGRGTPWTKLLDRAVALRSPGAVAVLCAAGLQNPEWANIPPVLLYHVISALRRVGYEAEARMIAAEALMRL